MSEEDFENPAGRDSATTVVMKMMEVDEGAAIFLLSRIAVAVDEGNVLEQDFDDDAEPPGWWGSDDRTPGQEAAVDLWWAADEDGEGKKANEFMRRLVKGFKEDRNE